ncbi:single-stranded DNA-binding protein [Streptomyces sp. NPDC052052]|uniref:single-stranded DNA-binding protein n=1 Tax=Streptomyces sp. NPDC052052 TaxID=3154756 RepID=UPI00342FF2F2
MNETLVTLLGNAATGVEFRETATGGMARFRFAVTPRRWDRTKQFWTDGHTSFYTVWAWRTLASNLCGSVSVGEPLVVHGRLKVREEEREGLRRTFVDVEAIAVGHDLTRGTAAFRRVLRSDPRLVARAGQPKKADEPDWSGGPRGSGRSDEGEEPGPAGTSYAVSRPVRKKGVESGERVGRQRAEGAEPPDGREKDDRELASMS